MKSSPLMKIAKSQFTKSLITQNRFPETAFKEWFFKPGMLFNDMNKWWQNGAQRPHPHEGVDFCCYINELGGLVYLREGIKIPALYDGRVVKIFQDFLGHSIMVAHDYATNGQRLVAIYAHTVPRHGLKAGQRIQADNQLAVIAAGRRNIISAHLHITTCWASETQLVQIDWQTIHDKQMVRLSNPMDYLR